MKKLLAILFIGSNLALVACQQKPKTEETSVNSTATTTMPADTMSMTADSMDTGAGMSSEMTSTTATTESTTK